MTAKDHYELLGVPSTASADEIRNAYQERANRYATQMNAASRDFDYHRQQLEKAYEVLINPLERSEYDKSIAK